MRYGIMQSAAALMLAGAAGAMAQGDVKAFVGARVIDGTGKPALEKATILVRNGRIEAVGASVNIPAGSQRIDLAGKTVIPGLISAHSHVNRAEQLGMFARDGITTVQSLGGDNEIQLRDQLKPEEQHPGFTRSRLYIAGPIPTSATAEEGRAAVDKIVAAKTEWVKFRLDDNLGAGKKMPPEAYSAIIDEAHKKGARVAVHVVYLADAKAVLRLGAEYIAHSVRDFDIDDEALALFKKTGAYYCPTLTREVSVFTYADTPAFFSDPFFLKEADRGELAKVQDVKYQAGVRASKQAAWYKEHLITALHNLKKLEDAGVPVVMGTDSGAPTGRFEGYFEHLEMEYMVRAGLTPMQTLVSATSTAARALRAQDQIGSIQPGRWADLVVLNANPLDDIKNTRNVDSVWIAGVQVPQKSAR
jgi:imidazolonepropionase-like amidohydrolase